MEHFDPEFVPNGSDSSARYSYKQQPSICKWNLQKFGEALSPFLSSEEAARALSAYDEIYEQNYQSLMRAKFGLAADPDPMPLVRQFFEVMEKTSCDFTDAFVALTECNEALLTVDKADSRSNDAIFEELLNKLVRRSASPSNMVEALRRKMRIHRLSMQPREIQQLWQMLERNPSEVSDMFGGAPVEAIRAEIGGEKKKLDMLVAASQGIEFYQSMTAEAKRSSDREIWRHWIKDYRARLEQQSITSSSLEEGKERVKDMRERNPTFVLRNWVAQDAIEQAEKSLDFSGVRTVLRMLETPFEPSFSTFVGERQQEGNGSSGSKGRVNESRYLVPPPDWAESLICTCSS